MSYRLGIARTQGIDGDIPLFRYVGLSQFLAFVETGRTSLTRLTAWDDTWEVPLGRLPVVSSSGQPDPPIWKATDHLFGQCWTRLRESDAMWRIYSPSKEGLRLETRVDRFDLLRSIDIGLLGEVTYFDDLNEAFEGCRQIRSKYPAYFHEGLYKRRAFEHEQEVRLITQSGDEFIGCQVEGVDRVQMVLDAREFLTGVSIDPRAADWFVDSVRLYCARHGFPFVPTVSDLYNTHPFEATGMSLCWAPVEPENSGNTD